MIGDCGLTVQSIDSEIKLEIGYRIAKVHQRKGYASEAARACRDWAFQNTDFEAVFLYEDGQCGFVGSGKSRWNDVYEGFYRCGRREGVGLRRDARGLGANSLQGARY